MHIKNLMIILMMAVTSMGLHAQQQPAVTDAARLNGEWQVEKVTTRLITQKDHKLLEEKTYTSVDSMAHVNGWVPLVIYFDGKDCEMRYRGTTQTGVYELPANGRLVFRKKIAGKQASSAIPGNPAIPSPGIPYTYTLQPGQLELHMPSTNYRDNATQQAVKLIYTCYYRKKP